jgi:hypothetical protein
MSAKRPLVRRINRPEQDALIQVKDDLGSFAVFRIIRGCADIPVVGRAMTLTQTCILAWAAVGLVVVAVLLRFLGREDEQARKNRS